MTAQKVTLLYVEDDENLAFVTIDNLEFNGYNVVHCTNGNHALLEFSNQKFDVCIFDVMLPELDGFELARIIRAQDDQIPIIFLTAKSLKEDKLVGLKLGADDYLTKPFSIEELVLRIEVFLKRSVVKVSKKSDEIYTIGTLTFDFLALTISGNSSKETLTMKEAELLRLFCQNCNKILKREEILKSIWGDDDYFMGRSMDVFISRLRKYLKSCNQVHLENIHNVGFRLNVE